MSITPKKLCIYYGTPNQVNGANGNITSAVNTFAAYDQVVFPLTVLASAVSVITTTDIISQLIPLNVAVYGEIDSTQSFNNIKQVISQWQKMNVTGIFCNNMGYDYSVSRSTQNQILADIHSLNLQAFVNATNPDDIFSNAVNATYNPTGTSSVIGSNDWYVAESYQITTGTYETVSNWTTISNKMVNYKQQFGTKMACITTDDTSGFSQSKMDYAYFSTILYGFDSFGWGEYNFSNGSNSLPFRTRTTFYGTQFDSPITNNNIVFERRTNVGIHVDTNAHTVNILLNM